MKINFFVYNTRIWLHNRATSDDSTYLMVPNEKFQMLHWFKLFGLEDSRVRERVRDQVLYCDDSDLGVWMGDEAHELGSTC